MRPEKQEFPQVDDMRLLDVFEAPHDDLLRYFGQFRAGNELHARRLKEYHEGLARTQNFKCSFHISHEDNSQPQNVGVLHFPKTKRNSVGVIVADWILLVFISNNKLNIKNIKIDSITILEELPESLNATDLHNLLSPQ